MKTLRNGLASFCVFLLMAVLSHAGVPGLISYQGQLNDETGAPVNGSVTFLFSIYDVETGGTALWSENQTVVVSNGVFSVQMGAVEPIPQSVFAKSQLYLGIRAGADDEMTPRQLITGTAYSQRSEILMPIGSIIAWHKSMPGTPPLTNVWVECNGQVLDDPDSPYDEETIPDLNSAGRILSGATMSGATADDLSHSHEIANYGSSQGGFRPLGGNAYQFGGTTAGPIAASLLQNFNNTVKWNFEIRDATLDGTFSVVWIMRVK